MFKTKRFGNIIISDQGFEVYLGDRGRDTLTYKEGEKRIFVNSESSTIKNKLTIAIWKSSIKGWEPPHGDQSIDDRKREEILANIEAALRFAKFNEVQVI